MQEDSFADTYSLPPLATIYGTLRAIYFRENRKDLKLANTDQDPTFNMDIQGLFFVISEKKEDSEQVYTELPGDLVMTKEIDNYTAKFEPLELVKNEDAKTSNPYPAFLVPKTQAKAKSGIWLLPLSEFQAYLKGEKKEFTAFNALAVITPEFKTGIKINNQTRTAQEAHLYNLKMMRYENNKFLISFLIKVDLNQQSQLVEIYEKPHTTRLGGEGRIASVSKEENNALITDIDALYALWKNQGFSKDGPPEGTNYTKLVFQSPSPITHQFGKEQRITEQDLFRVQPLAATMPKPVKLSGFDLKTRRPKPMVGAIPSRAVYYFDKNHFDTLLSYHGTRLCSQESYQRQGCGLTFLGVQKNLA